MKKYQIRERVRFDEFGNMVATPWVNCKGMCYNSKEEAEATILYLKSLCKKYEYKIIEKEVNEK